MLWLNSEALETERKKKQIQTAGDHNGETWHMQSNLPLIPTATFLWMNATFLWMIRMFGLSFVSSKDNAPLNLDRSVSECSI